MGMGFPFPMVFPQKCHEKGNISMPKMGTGTVRVHMTMEMGMAIFSSVQNSHRSNQCKFLLYVEDNMTEHF